MVNCWFGARWFGILLSPWSNNPFYQRGSYLLWKKKSSYIKNCYKLLVTSIYSLNNKKKVEHFSYQTSSFLRVDRPQKGFFSSKNGNLHGKTSHFQSPPPWLIAEALQHAGKHKDKEHLHKVLEFLKTCQTKGGPSMISFTYSPWN